jgi:hypothetical protein
MKTPCHAGPSCQKKIEEKEKKGRAGGLLAAARATDTIYRTVRCGAARSGRLLGRLGRNGPVGPNFFFQI